MAEDFVARMSQLAEKIVKEAGDCHNEEQTKQSLIQFVLDTLGYDISNPNEVIMEYGKPESVDYAIKINGILAFLIEAKAVKENLNLDRHVRQLAGYFTDTVRNTDCRHAVLTNGLEWRFFSDLDKDNVMDKEPYRIIDMRSLSTDDIMFLSGFRKDRFSAEGLRSKAEKAMYASKINDYIRRNIIDSMSDEIVKFITGKVCGSKSKATVDKFRPIIETEFSRCLAAKYGIASSHVREKDENPTDLVSIPTGREAEGKWPILVTYLSESTGFSATARIYEHGRTVVEAGSIIRRDAVKSLRKNIIDKRNEVLSQMTPDQHGRYVLKDALEFDSPSAAASFVSGANTSVNNSWEDESGYKLNL